MSLGSIVLELIWVLDGLGDGFGVFFLDVSSTKHSGSVGFQFFTSLGRILNDLNVCSPNLSQLNSAGRKDARFVFFVDVHFQPMDQRLYNYNYNGTMHQVAF